MSSMFIASDLRKLLCASLPPCLSPPVSHCHHTPRILSVPPSSPFMPPSRAPPTRTHTRARVSYSARVRAHTRTPGRGTPTPLPPGGTPHPLPPTQSRHKQTCPTYPKHGAKQDHNTLTCTLCHPFRRGRRFVPHTETIRHPPPPPRHTHESAHTPPNRTRSLPPVTTPTRPIANTSL